LCNVSVVPNTFPNITSLNISFSITNDRETGYGPISSSDWDKPTNSLTSTCLGIWINSWLSNYSPTNTGLPSLSTIASNPKCNTSYFTSAIPGDAKRIENYTSHPFSNLTISNVELIDDNLEEYSNILVTYVNSNKSPLSLLESFFIYSVPISFVGSMLYTSSSVFSMNLADTVTNKNLLIFIYFYIGICGLFAFLKWFNVGEISGPFGIIFNIYNIKMSLK
jgi:hypothetical protein